MDKEVITSLGLRLGSAEDAGAMESKGIKT